MWKEGGNAPLVFFESLPERLASNFLFVSDADFIPGEKQTDGDQGYPPPAPDQLGRQQAFQTWPDESGFARMSKGPR